MAYRLEPGEPLGDGLRRVIAEQLEDARERLETVADDPVTAIHEARKRFKQVRAVLRLVRPVWPAETYRREARSFRDLGRRLAPVRDAQVGFETVRGMEGLAAEDREPILAELARRMEAAVEEGIRPDGIALVREGVAEAAVRVDEWPLAERRFRLVGPGLERVARQAAERYFDARSRRTDEAFHDWRKRVKDRWYHLRLFAATSPRLLGPEVDALKELSDALGLEHDLTVVATAFPHSEALAEVVGSEKAKLRERALALGRELHAETAEVVRRRLRDHWRAARRGASGDRA